MIATEVQVAAVGTLTVLINAFTVCFGAYLNYRSSQRNHKAIQTVGSSVQEIKKSTNSLQDKLVASTQLAGEAKGRDDERARQKFDTAKT